MIPTEIEQMRKFEAQPEKIFDFTGMMMGLALLVILFGAALLTVECLDYSAEQRMPSAAFRLALPIENHVHL